MKKNLEDRIVDNKKTAEKQNCQGNRKLTQQTSRDPKIYYLQSKYTVWYSPSRDLKRER